MALLALTALLAALKARALWPDGRALYALSITAATLGAVLGARA